MCDTIKSVGEQLAEIDNHLDYDSRNDYENPNATLLDMPVEVSNFNLYILCCLTGACRRHLHHMLVEI